MASFLSGRIKDVGSSVLLKNPFRSLSGTILRCYLLQAVALFGWMMKVSYFLGFIGIARLKTSLSSTWICWRWLKMAPRAILPTGSTPDSSSSAAAAATAPASASPAGVASQVPPQPSGGSRAKKGPSKRERPPVVNVDGEEEVKENPSTDLKKKRRRREGKGEDLVDRVLGEDAAWEHEVNPLDLAFPKGYNYKKALDAGLTSVSVRKPLQTMPPEQLLRESGRLSC
ncbi:hypothetical protein PIB30_083375 [Stylosanthes scabra]|uniref:Uncharacterized protein n=1 Tax=Stylosanthes scabra TaxID=79078 RepID=A0ABU6TSX1_9FABA|nr:hypothetical protein [Stylosanthes scabra]